MKKFLNACADVKNDPLRQDKVDEILNRLSQLADDKKENLIRYIIGRHNIPGC